MELHGLNEFARRYTQAWNSQDPHQVASFYAEDGSLRVNDGAPAVGRAAIADVARGFMTAFPDMEVLLDHVTLTAESTKYHWTLKGTNDGSGGTGKRVEISGFESWRFAGGLIAESKGWFDAAEYERQLKHGATADRP